jgi:hypothetical protein
MEEKLLAKPRPARVDFKYSYNMLNDTDLDDAGIADMSFSLFVFSCLNVPLEGLDVAFDMVNIQPFTCDNRDTNINGNRDEYLYCVSDNDGCILADFTPTISSSDWEISATITETGDECSIHSSQTGGAK